MYKWIFISALSSTLLGRAWQVACDSRLLGAAQDFRWLYVSACLVAIVVMLTVILHPHRFSHRVIWTITLGAVGVLLIIPVITVLGKPLHAYSVGKFAAQFLAPMLVGLTVMSCERATIIRVGLIATTLCFGLHGILDLGFPATPTEYLLTSQAALGWEEPAVRRFLAVVGIADLIVAVLIWWRVTQIPALMLAATWGACTIAARIIAWGHWDFSLAYHESWTYETLIRLPHILVPLGTCLLAWQAPYYSRNIGGSARD